MIDTIRRQAVQLFAASCWLLGCVEPSESVNADVDTAAGTPSAASAASQALLTNMTAETLTITVDWRGERPTEATLDFARETLADLVAVGAINKRGSVTLTLGGPLPESTASASYTTSELQDTQAMLRQGTAASGAIHVLWTDGSYNAPGGDNVLGFAYGENSIVMLEDNLARNCLSLDGLLPALLNSGSACDLLKATVLVHELGHIFGLVNRGAPMVTPHEDSDHPKHDMDSDCLMYWLVESDAAAGVAADILNGGVRAPAFCDSCVDDMRAVAEQL